MKTTTITHTVSESKQDAEARGQNSKDTASTSETLQYPDDCEGLDYHVDEAAQLRLGFVEYVNGLGECLAPEFIPTRFELEIIAEHWLTHLLERGAHSFADCRPANEFVRENVFANRRFMKLQALLGQPKIERIAAKVDAKMEAIFGETFWRDFRGSAIE